MELFTALTGRERPTLVRAQESGAPVRRQKRVVLDPARGDIGLPALAKDLMVKIVGQQRARTITFMRSIPEVDQVYGYVAGELKRQHKGVSPKTVREYKREIPSEEKAEVTADLRTGATLGVISTTALQLGIDIGDLSVGLVCKFPGSKAAFMQQAGRVGRSGESLILFVADSSPLDQHYVARPEELLDGPPEVVFLNAHHRETVLKHLWCAAEELALDPQRDAKYWGPSIQDLIDELATQPGMTKQGREVLVLGKKKGQKAREVNIRSMGFECSVYDAKRSLVAKPDVLRAMRRYHKYARFRIQDDAFEVTQLSINWNNKEAEASAKKLETARPHDIIGDSH
jgi:DEAD/DEAH box helicase domain-containing protein